MIGQHIGTLSLALLYILAMFGWGSLFMVLFPARDRHFWNDFASRIVSGFGLLCMGFIGLSIPGLLRPAGIGVLLVAGVLASCFFISSFVKSADIPGTWVSWALTDRILAISIGSLVILQILIGLTPLIFYDLQVYHLLAPAEFLKSGSLAHIPWNVQTNSPLALQLTLGMSLVLDSSGQVAKLLITIFGCLFCAAIFEFMRPAGSRAALLATLFVLCYPEFWIMQTLGVVDIAAASFVILGAVWLRQAFKNQTWEPAVLCGIALGIANGSRYQAVVLTALVVVVALAEHIVLFRSRLPIRRTLLQLALVGSVAAILIGPWLVRNDVHMGNPVYPLMQQTWGGHEWSAEQNAQLRAETLGSQIQSGSMMQKLISPLQLLFAPPSNYLFGAGLLLGTLLAFWSSSRDIRFAAIIGFAGLILWGLIHPATGVALMRYNAASIVFLLAAAGAVLGSTRISPKIGTGVATALACGSLVVSLVQLQGFIPVTQSLTNPQLWESLREVNVPSWAALDYVNEHLDPTHDNVLLIGESRGFWLHVPYIAPSSFNGPQLDAIFGGNSDPGAWGQTLAHMGITHLLISYPELQRLHERYGYLNLPPARMAEFSRWIQTLPRTFEDSRGTDVYTLH